MGDIKSWITQSSKTALGDLLGIRECTGSGVPIFEKQSEKAIEKNNRKNTTPKKQRKNRRLSSTGRRKAGFLVQKLKSIRYWYRFYNDKKNTKNRKLSFDGNVN